MINELVSTDVKNNDVSGIEKEKVFLTQKAYCIMFRNKHYPLQYKILATLLRIQKHEMTRNSTNINLGALESVKRLQEYESLMHDVEAMIGMPLISEKCQEFLHNLYQEHPKNYKSNDSFEQTVPYQIGNLKYVLPSNSEFLDMKWHGPFFLNQLKFEDFYYIFK